MCERGGNMIYRLATEKDIPMLSEMRWQHEYEEEDQFDISKEDFIKECNLFLIDGLKNGTWDYWIAEEKDIIISNIYISRIRKVPKPQKLFAEIGYVTNVHTKAEFRNKGIGTELIKKVKQWALDNKMELLFVWPSERSINFYERQGFSMQNEIMELEV
jgi:RimJ/RimL family protein N-acetyltransferase